MKTPKYTAEKIFALALSGLAPMLATAQTGTYPDADEGKGIESTLAYARIQESATYDALTWADQPWTYFVKYNYTDGTSSALLEAPDLAGAPLESTSVEFGAYGKVFNFTDVNLTYKWTVFNYYTTANFDNASLNLSSRQISDGRDGGQENDLYFATVNLKNGSALNYGVGNSVRFWFSNLDMQDSSMTGGLNLWHTANVSLKNSDITATGTLLQIHGNGNSFVELDNSAMSTSTTASGLQLYGHAASENTPIEITLKNNSKFTAGAVSEINGFTATSGGDSWIGWTNTENGKITVNIESGSEMILGSTAIGRQDAYKQAAANYGINISGSEGNISKLITRNLILNTSTNEAATETSYNTFVNVGEYSLLSANSIFIADVSNAVSGTAKISVASNSQVMVYQSSALKEGDETIYNDGGAINVGTKVRAGGNAIFEADGSSIRVETSTISIGSDTSTGGSNTFSIKNTSTDVSKQNYVSAFNYEMKNSKVEGSTQTNRLVIDGNTYVSGRTSPYNGDKSLRFNVATNESASGVSELVLKGENLEFGYFFQLNAGNEASTGGQGIITIATSSAKSNGQNGFYISNNMSILGGDGTSAENPIGGVLRMQADESGFGYVNANAINFTGILELDFTKLLGKYEEGVTFKLINARNTNDSSTWLSFCDNLVLGDYSNINIKLRDETDEVIFELNGGELSVIYTSYVPEPSTFAALFGAIALAFAMYRRRK